MITNIVCMLLFIMHNSIQLCLVAQFHPILSGSISVVIGGTGWLGGRMFGCSKKQGTAGIWREQQAPTGKVQNTEGPSGKCPKPKDKTTGSTEKFPKHRQKHNGSQWERSKHTNTAGPYGKCSKHTEKQNRPQWEMS